MHNTWRNLPVCPQAAGPVPSCWIRERKDETERDRDRDREKENKERKRETDRGKERTTRGHTEVNNKRTLSPFRQLEERCDVEGYLKLACRTAQERGTEDKLRCWKLSRCDSLMLLPHLSQAPFYLPSGNIKASHAQVSIDSLLLQVSCNRHAKT